MANRILFTFPIRHQGIEIAECEGVARVELIGDDYWLDIRIDELGTGLREVTAVGPLRDEIEKYLVKHYREDIAEAEASARAGRISAHRESARHLQAAE